MAYLRNSNDIRVVMQQDSMLCGAACLKMICDHYGVAVGMEELEELCCPTPSGVSALSIKVAAEKLGFKFVCCKASVDSLADMPLPCILHWQQNHYVVLYREEKGKFYIADPKKGKVCLATSDMEEKWVVEVSSGRGRGIAILLEKENSNDISHPVPTKHHSMSVLWNYMKAYKGLFLQIFLGLLVGSAIELVLPFLTQHIVDSGIANKDIGLVWLILLGQSVLTFSQTCISFIRSWLLLHISMRVNISLVSDFFKKLLRLPMGFFDTKLTGDLLQRMNDYDRVNNFLTSHLLSVVYSAICLVIFSAVLLIYSKIVFATFIAGSTIYILWGRIFMDRRRVLDYEYFEQQAVNNERTYQFVTSMQEIKLQGCENRRRWEWEDTQIDLLGVQMKSLKLQQTQETGSIFLNEIKNSLITVLSATAVINGNLTLGMMLAIQYVVGQLNSPIEQLMAFIYSLQDVRISMDRIDNIQKRKEENGIEGGLQSLDGSNCDICLSRVGFKYDKNLPSYQLKDVDIVIPEGKLTAVVGASGSGKSTLMKLLLGFYTPIEGEILIGDRPLSAFNIKWWRAQCGAVMQNGKIFSESIARNIAVEDKEVDTSKLINAAQMANIYEDIIAMPLKFDTIIGDSGMSLSQGQRQRILIARAIYKEPRFLFLDEATNSLDSSNEKTITDNLAKFYDGRTAVVIAHRLSTVKNADQIIVIDKGTVVEKGNHEQLIAKRGTYYTLVKNQLELGE